MASSSQKNTQIPLTASSGQLAPSIKSFLKSHPDLHLGGQEGIHAERWRHLEVFGFHALPEDLRAPIGRVEFTAVRTRHGTVPIRVFYPRSRLSSAARKEGVEAAAIGAGGGNDGEALMPALVYFHGGGYTVGSVDEFENGLRLLAEKANMITIGVDYHLAPEHKHPVQLDEYVDVLTWVQGPEGKKRGIDGSRVLGGGDSAGGNMTAAVALRLRDEGAKQMKGQLLLYPEARLPFDTPAAIENASGLYLESNGIFSFASNYLPRAPASGPHPTSSHPYVSPGMQKSKDLKNLPPTAVFTCGFDPLRDVGVEYAHKLQQAGVQVEWRHYPKLTHGFLQMAPWSKDAASAVEEAAHAMRWLAGDHAEGGEGSSRSDSFWVAARSLYRQDSL